MDLNTLNNLVNILSEFENLVEIGIGSRTDVSNLLIKNSSVVATDIHECIVPSGVKFVIDDITNPVIDVYSNSDAIYALNMPPELHQYALNVSLQVGSKFIFTTLGGDFPEIPVYPQTIPGETLYWASG